MKKLLLILFISSYSITNAQYTYTKIFNFSGTADGNQPKDNVITDGTFLYGMTVLGGANNLGALFKVMPDGSGYVNLIDFAGASNGRSPRGSLYYDGTYLYGMTQWGGVNDSGTIFKILPNGTGYTKLYDFSGTTDGRAPRGYLISDATYLYGMTQLGGTNNMGVIFKIKLNGTGYSKLLDFAGTTNGSTPNSSLVSDGTYLYGLTELGGTNNLGVAFKIMPNGTGYSKLLDFSGTTNGSYPWGSLVSDGTYLYGMTQMGGANNYGVVFKILPTGSGYADILDFNNTNGKYPYGSLIINGSYLYGMTSSGGVYGDGTIFKIMTNGTSYSDMFDFNGMTTGFGPFGSLLSIGGCFYGMANGGGINNDGVIFSECFDNGIAENIIQTNFKIYPNPTSDQFFIETNTTDKLTVDLYDVNGRHVFSKKIIGKATIDATDFQNGIYFIRLKSDLSVYTKKIIVQH